VNLNRREVAGIALRMGFWLPLLFWIGWKWGVNYAELFLPVYREVLGLTLSGFQFAEIEIVRGHEYLFKAPYVTERAILFGQHLVASGLEGYVQAPIYYAVTHPIVLAATALIWPGLTWHGRLVRLLVSLPILLVLECIDVPLVMYSSITSAVLQSYDPASYLADRPTDWINLLEGGGRSALCIVASIVAAWLHNVLGKRLSQRGAV